MESIGHFKSIHEIESLVDAFNSNRLLKSEWTHEAHLTVAIWYLDKYTFDEAICYIRSKIILYNNSVGTENTSTMGYHETFTLFWITIIKKFLDQSNLDLLTNCNQFLKSPMSSRNYPLEFYSRDLIFSTKARAMYCTPDLRTIID